jgi:hypothetical protein
MSDYIDVATAAETAFASLAQDMAALRDSFALLYLPGQIHAEIKTNINEAVDTCTAAATAMHTIANEQAP